MEDISRLLADVKDWKGLAGSLNVRSSDIETYCAQDVAQTSCYRREIVRRYLNNQLPKNPRTIVEDIAQALETMNHKIQAQQLREFEFSKSMAKRNTTVERAFPIHKILSLSKYRLK